MEQWTAGQRFLLRRQLIPNNINLLIINTLSHFPHSALYKIEYCPGIQEKDFSNVLKQEIFFIFNDTFQKSHTYEKFEINALHFFIRNFKKFWNTWILAIFLVKNFLEYRLNKWHQNSFFFQFFDRTFRRYSCCNYKNCILDLWLLDFFFSNMI